MHLPERILIVDASALCYSAYFSMGQLARRDGYETGVIYGFFMQLGNVCKALKTAHIAFCWDSKKSRRREIFAEYKASRQERKRTPSFEAAYMQFHQIRDEIIPRLNFVNNFLATGFEADDIIASICLNSAPTAEQQYIILSSDQDLYQLLADRVSMYKMNKKAIYTKQDFMAEWNLPPHQWAYVKALAGCSGDDVPGIPKVGEKTAAKYLAEPHTKFHKLIDTIEGQEIFQRNKPLVTLPFKGTPVYTLDWETMPSFAAWIEECERLEFFSFIKNSATWEDIFSLTPPSDGLDKVLIGGKRPKA